MDGGNSKDKNGNEYRKTEVMIINETQRRDEDINKVQEKEFRKGKRI